jgi:ABC-type Fe3+-hydroxamate transport system substrate-binding protein
MPVFRFRPAVLLLAFVAASCKPAERAPVASVVAEVPRDDFGNEIKIGAHPQRIVSLNPTTTEVLFAIGAGARMVGRSEYDNFPEAARVVPSVGAAIRPNVEAILARHPDLVLLYASDDNRAASDRLRQAGIAAVAMKIDSIQEFARDTRLIGRITGDSARAAKTVDSVEATIARVRAATAHLPKPTVFIHAWERPIIAIGGGSFMSELLDIAGARNVYADIAAPSATVTLEDVIKRNPDLILASPLTAPQMRSSANWRTVPAVRAGRILAYDTVLVGRPSVLLGAAAHSLANLIHPGSVR